MTHKVDLGGVTYDFSPDPQFGGGTYDGGAIGGAFKKYPSGMCHAKKIGWCRSPLEAADALQIVQQHRFERASKFVDQFRRELAGER